MLACLAIATVGSHDLPAYGQRLKILELCHALFLPMPWYHGMMLAEIFPEQPLSLEGDSFDSSAEISEPLEPEEVAMLGASQWKRALL